MIQKITGKPLTYFVVSKKSFQTQVLEFPYKQEQWERIMNIIQLINNDKTFKKCNQFRCLYCNKH